MRFKQGAGDWTHYRTQFGLLGSDEVDLHLGPRDKSIPYDVAMAELTNVVAAALERAQRDGRSHILFLHGRSTSGPGKTTARSQVRKFMRSTAATPLIERSECIQHESVFVAKLKLG